MRKSSTVAMDRIENFRDHKVTIGLDLGDRFSHYCILNEAGEIIGEHNQGFGQQYSPAKGSPTI